MESFFPLAQELGYDDPEDYYDFFEEDDPEETSDQQFCIVWWNRKDRPTIKIPGTWTDDDRDFVEAYGYDRVPEVRSLLEKATDKEEVAMKYATDKDPRIRMEVARSKFVPEKALEILVCDDDSDVRRPAVNSKKCTEDLMQKALLKHPKDGTLYEIIMKHPNASVEFMEKNLKQATSIEAFEFFVTNRRVPVDKAVSALEYLLEGLDPVKNGNKHFDFTFYNIVMSLRRKPEAAFAEVLLSWARKILEQCRKDDPSFDINDGMYKRAISIVVDWKDIPEKTREEGLELICEFGTEN